jgi:hypothetical protein
MKTNSDRRITAIGCQNGWLGVYFVDSFKNGLFNLNYLAKNRVFDIWIPFIKETYPLGSPREVPH